MNSSQAGLHEMFRKGKRYKDEGRKREEGGKKEGEREEKKSRDLIWALQREHDGGGKDHTKH